MKRIIIFLFIIAVAVLIGINLKNTEGRTIEANPNDNIQDVVDGANSGDTILFSEGTYDKCNDGRTYDEKPLPINALWVNKSLTFKSEKLPKNRWRKNGREKYNPSKVKLKFSFIGGENAVTNYIGLSVSRIGIRQGDNSIINHSIFKPRYPNFYNYSSISLIDNSEEYTTNTIYVRNSYLINTAFNAHSSVGVSEIISENCWWGYEDGAYSPEYQSKVYKTEVTINSWYKTPIYDNKITRGMKINNMLESQTLHNQSINNLSTSLDYYNSKLSFFKTKLYTIENNTGTNHTEYDNLKKLIETLSNSKNQTLSMLETKVTNLESNLSDAEEDIIALEKNNTNLKNQLDYQNSTIIKMDKDISTLKSEINKLKTDSGTRSEPLTAETKAIGLKEIIIPAIVIVTAVVLIGLVYRKIH